MSAAFPIEMRASDAVLRRCRSDIEGPVKRRVRAFLVPLLARRHGFAALGEGFQWGRPLHVRRGAVHVGRFAYLGAGFDCGYRLDVGDLVMIAAGVSIMGDDHRFDRPGTPTRLAFAPAAAPTIIGADAWIGAGSTILAGVHIGHGAVIGARALVTRDVPPFSVAVGVPARVVRTTIPAAAMPEHARRVFDPAGCIPAGTTRRGEGGTAGVRLGG